MTIIMLRKIFSAVLLFIAINTLALAATVPVTGTFRTPGGNLLNGSIKFQLPYAGAVDTNCPGNCIVTPTVTTFTINAGQLASFARLTRNGDITPAGTYYRAFLFDSYGTNLSVSNFVIPAGVSTFDVSSALQSTITTQNISYVPVAPIQNFSLKPATNDAYQFVSNSGNDSNDGLSMGTAKLTMAAACAAIPGQNSGCTQAGAFGTIFISATFSGSLPNCLTTFAGTPCTAVSFIGGGFILSSSTIQTYGTFVLKTTNSGYVFMQDGFQMTVQSGGPRAAGPVLAKSTWTIPDAAQGGAVDTSGELAGMVGVGVVGGNCMFSGGVNTSPAGGILKDAGQPCGLRVAGGTASMTTAGIGTGACGTTVTVAVTGALTTDTITFSRNAAATNGNGGNLILNAWTTSNNVNFNYCNPSAGTVTPTAMTVNWILTR